MPLDLVVVDVVAVTGFDSNLMEELAIIVLLLCLHFFLFRHLSQLMGLDILEHLGFFASLVYFLLCFLGLQLLNSFDPILISHVQLGCWIEVHNCVFGSDPRNGGTII